MGYDMTKYDYKKWDCIEESIRVNKRKILKGKKRFVKKLYQEQMGKDLDYSNPQTFNEILNVNKTNFIMNFKYSKYADKYKVRKYIEKKIGGNYLNKLYFSKKKITVKDLEELPNSFVLKTNNGSGTNYIVKDKSKENLEELCNYMNRLVKIKYGYIWGEFLYNHIKPRIIAERILLDKEGNIPDDLKCFCFKNKSGLKRKILYYERVIDDERYRIMFDEKWNTIDLGSSFGKLDIKIKKPNNYKKIIKVIDKLSDDFNFVRVDLFLLNDKIYFGELTFIPTAGYLKFDNNETDMLWGRYLR